MKEYILQVVKSLPKGGHLSVEERNVLSTAYKSILSPKRNAWRTIDALMQKEKNDSCGECCTDIKKLMEYEMLCICAEVIDVINKYLLVDSDSTPEDIDDRLYYLKMQGDYYRYEAEFLEDDLRSDAVKHSQQCYERAASGSDNTQGARLQFDFARPEPQLLGIPVRDHGAARSWR